jgi:hypothetical protein
VQQTSSFSTTSIRNIKYLNDAYLSCGAAGKIATSLNGVNWTQRTSSFGVTNINGLALTSAKAVAVGDTGKIAVSVG